MQVHGPAGGAERGPGGEGRPGGVAGELRLARAAAGDLGERLLVDRGQVDEALGARDPLAADEVVGETPTPATSTRAASVLTGLRDGLEVVDRVAEREAEALPHPHRGERRVLLVGGAEELERRRPLPDLRDDAVAAARPHELVDGRVVVAAGREAGEVADVHDRRVVVRRPGLRDGARA